MILQERLEQAFSQLGWTRIPEILHRVAEEASKENISYVEFLDNLLQEEIMAKNDRYVTLKTKQAHLPYHKTLDPFEFSFQPSIDEKIRYLLENIFNSTMGFQSRKKGFRNCYFWNANLI